VMPDYQPEEGTRRSLEEDVAHRAQLWRAAGVERSFRASVPPIKVLEFAREAGLTGRDWCADAAFGIVIGIADEQQQREAIRAAAGAVGGSVYFTERPRRTRVELDDGVAALLRRLKKAFDLDEQLEPLPEPP